MQLIVFAMIACLVVVCFSVIYFALGLCLFVFAHEVFVFCFPCFISGALLLPATNIVIIGEKERKREVVAVITIAAMTNTKT